MHHLTEAERNMGEWFYPDDPELDERNRKWQKEWEKTCSAKNIRNNMPLNFNGVKRTLTNLLTPEVVKAESLKAHQFALSLVGDNTGPKAWTIYMSIVNAYVRYIKKGYPATINFDATKLQVLL